MCLAVAARVAAAAFYPSPDSRLYFRAELKRYKFDKVQLSLPLLLFYLSKSLPYSRFSILDLGPPSRPHV